MDVYGIVTEKMIGMLEQGTVPWRKPWVSAGMPRNLVSKKPYRGINFFLLSATKYVSPYWLTYKQATELGGHVRKGEKATLVVFWKIEARKDPDAQEGEISSKDGQRFILRYYNVFNLDQCEMPEKVLAKLEKPETHENESIEACERVVAEMPNPPVFEHGGSMAYYRPSTDTINLPAKDLFNSAAEYYATAFHEMTHSTGATKRLARGLGQNIAPFGSADYSKEELVAEMGSAFLCAETGISPAVIENQASYIAGWLKKLRDDRKWVVLAAAQAQKASEYILNRQEPTA